jgi:hypothetical protein
VAFDDVVTEAVTGTAESQAQAQRLRPVQLVHGSHAGSPEVATTGPIFHHRDRPVPPALYRYNNARSILRVI